MNSPEERDVLAQVELVRGKLQALTDDLRVVDLEVERLAPQRTQHELLDQACGSLEKLGELGADELFWGEEIDVARVAEQLRGVRGRVSAFQAQLGEFDARRDAILADIGREEQNLEILGEDLYDIREQEERRKLEWVVERESGPDPARPQQMAWTHGGEDDRRFRKSLTASLLVSVSFGALLPMIPLPLPKRFEPKDVPQRLAQLVREAQAKPVLPPPAPEPPKAEDREPQEEQEPDPVEETKPSNEPAPVDDTAVAASQPEADLPPGPKGPGPSPKQAVAKAGILAFKDKFASLAKDDAAPRLGASARYGDADEASRASTPTRSMLTTNTPGSSGGINIASLSRNVGGGGGGNGAGGAMQGVGIGRATSSIASIGGGGGGRPLAHGGPGPSRTDEEIQIVFDRYKAAFYRLYNRELRKDPTLRGQMVLRLTIEPDGSVSMCTLQSSDMHAPDLAAQVVERVLKINFGAKEGVKALTIVYPIDFLPAA